MVSFFGKGDLLIFRHPCAFIRWSFLLGLLLFGAEASAAPVDLSVRDWSIEAVERLAARGLCEGLGLGLRPATRDWVARRVAEAIQTIEEKDLNLSSEMAYQIEEDLLRLSETFAPELRALGVAEAGERGEARRPGQPFQWKEAMFGTMLVGEKFLTSFDRQNSTSLIENSQGLRLKDGFNGRGTLPSWLSLGDWFAATFNPGLRGSEEDSDIDLDLEEASAKLAYWNLELKGGLLNFWWGPGYHGDLLLTNNPRPLRAFSLRTLRGFRLPWKLEKLGKWEAQLIGARLEEKRTVKESFLTGTRFEWSPTRRLVVGASHLALFGGEGEEEGFIDFLNALDPTEGGATEERANHLFGADLRIFLAELARWIKVGSGLELYGEFFGEDTKGIYIPEFVSYLGGFLITDLFSWPGLDFRFEGVRVHKNAYEHFVHTSGHRFKNEFLGHHAGPDSDDFFFRLSQVFDVLGKRVVAGFQFDRERRGISGEALQFGQSALAKNEVQVDFLYEFSDKVDLIFAYQFEDVNNFRGSTGIDSHNHIFSLKTVFRF